MIWTLLMALPVARYVSSQWLEQFMFRIQPQWRLYAADGAGVVLLVVFVVSIQAIKAARANPADSLRKE